MRNMESLSVAMYTMKKNIKMMLYIVVRFQNFARISASIEAMVDSWFGIKDNI